MIDLDFGDWGIVGLENLENKEDVQRILLEDAINKVLKEDYGDFKDSDNYLDMGVIDES